MIRAVYNISLDRGCGFEGNKNKRGYYAGVFVC